LSGKGEINLLFVKAKEEGKRWKERYSRGRHLGWLRIPIKICKKRGRVIRGEKC